MISQASPKRFEHQMPHIQLLFASRFFLSQRPSLSVKWFYLSQIPVSLDDVMWQQIAVSSESLILVAAVQRMSGFWRHLWVISDDSHMARKPSSR